MTPGASIKAITLVGIPYLALRIDFEFMPPRQGRQLFLLRCLDRLEYPESHHQVLSFPVSLIFAGRATHALTKRAALLSRPCLHHMDPLILILRALHSSAFGSVSSRIPLSTRARILTARIATFKRKFRR